MSKNCDSPTCAIQIGGLQQDIDMLRKALKVAKDGLSEIGKHQHNGHRSCTCDIVGRTKDQIEATLSGTTAQGKG